MCTVNFYNLILQEVTLALLDVHVEFLEFTLTFLQEELGERNFTNPRWA